MIRNPTPGQPKQNGEESPTHMLEHYQIRSGRSCSHWYSSIDFPICHESDTIVLQQHVFPVCYRPFRLATWFGELARINRDTLNDENNERRIYSRRTISRDISPQNSHLSNLLHNTSSRMMRSKLFLTFAFVVLASPALTDSVRYTKGRGDGVEIERSKLRRMAISTPAWWNSIKATYNGTDLKLCKSSSAPPSGSSCGKERKTCFFGTRNCTQIGAYPTTRCRCNGTLARLGKWNCTNVACPPVKNNPTPAGVFRSSPGRAFKVQMNLLTPKVLQGYDNVADLTADIKQAVMFLVNSVIERMCNYRPRDFIHRPVLNLPNFRENPSDGVTDFSTNNQEEGVDELDLVKSDGIYTYAAYGDVAVIWNAATGKLVANYTLPPIEERNATKAGIERSFPVFYYQPKPIIQGLSLASNRLVLYVQGYGEEARSKRDASAFSNAYDTRVVILDTSALPAKIKVVSEQDIQGSFRDARSIGSDVHVVTTSYIDYYEVTGPLYRWNEAYKGLSDSQYKAKAKAIALPLIDGFVDKLVNDIVEKGLVPSIPKISIWQSDLGNSTNIMEQLYSGGAIQAFVQLTSFSVQALTGDPVLSTAGAFTPSSWGYTYAVGGNLVFAMQGWNWNRWWRGSSQTTYLMGFKLDGATATPAYMGSVDGYIINQYSLSVFEGHLRIATTVDTFWPVWRPVEDSSGFTIPPQPVSRTNNTVFVLKIPTGAETTLKTVTAIPSLGKPNERFTAVRFFGKYCYVGKCLGLPCICRPNHQRSPGSFLAMNLFV